MKFFHSILLLAVLIGYPGFAGAYGNAVNTWDNTVSPPRESFVAMGGVDPGLGGQPGMTVTAWVRWLGDQSAADDWANIISNNAHNASDNGQFWLQHDDANERFEFAVRGGGRSYVYSTTQPQVGVWYHVAGVYDSTLSGNTLATRRVKIYVNGILEASNNNVSGTITAWVNTYFLNIGRWAYTSERRFEGDIDEVSLWNRALSETEIRDLMTKKLAASEAGLVGYWPLDEASGDLAADLSPSGRNGRVYGETGIVTSGTGTTLTDTSKTWTLDQWAGHKVFILNNTGVGQERDIVSNTATTLTVSPAWTTNPALNSRYAISAFDRWVCSDAPVGDESIFIYNFSSGDTVSFPDDVTPIFSAQNITGTILPQAVHIYRVNQPPNFTTSTSPDILNFDVSPYYWGVHVIGGTDPDYTVHYTYTGHPQVTVSNESGLILAHRAANCTTPWTDLVATLNTGTDTLSQTTQNGGEYILGVPMGSATDFIVYKTVTDENGGNPETGDILLYTIVIQKPNAASLANAVFTDATPAGTTYVPNSATAPIGSTIVTEDPLSITGIDVPDHGQVTITFRVTITGGSGTTISNQGDLYYDSNADGSNDAHQLSNAAAVTVAAPSTPNFDQTVKSVDLIDDLNLNGAINAGDTLRYTVKICNTGDADAVGVSFMDAIPADTAYVAGTASASEGSVSYNGVSDQIEWSGTVAAGMLKCVTITFDVTVDLAVPDGTVISNQGTVTYGADTIDTDGDPFLPGKQTTDVIVATMPRGVAVKNVTDENGGNVEAGDYLLYTIEFDNFTTVDVNGLVLTDAIPNNTAYVAGSAAVPTGCVIESETPVLVISNIDMPGHSKKTFTFRVQVDNPLPSGVNQILNQGTVFYDSDGDGTNDATQLTDGDTSQYGNQPTIIAVNEGPNFDQTTKSVSITSDIAPLGIATPGDTLRYNIKIRNTGDLNATGVVFHDPAPPFHTTWLGNLTASSGTVNYTAGQVEWNGNVNIGATVVITFDVIIGAGEPIGTVISNQGIVYYATDGSAPNDSFRLTDSDLTEPGHQPTTISIGGFAHAYGIKTAVDLNGGNLEPGDRVEYTIFIENTSGFDGNGVELWDPIPNNTVYVTGSASAAVGAVSYDGVANQIYWTGNVLANSTLTITFEVDLDNPMAAGVTQISNQATAFYDSDTDGINDTYQSTDGDGDLTNGNQPTVSNLSAGTISGTVFDDANEDGVKDLGELGIPGVAVDLYVYNTLTSLYDLLYGTVTDIDGYYEFTGLPANDYRVVETDLPYYESSIGTPNSVDLTLPSGGAETVDFGDYPNGYADLSLSKTCATFCANGTDQLAYIITIVNNGPETAYSAILEIDFTSMMAAGLSDIEYTVDGGTRNTWAGTLPLGDMDIAPDPSYSYLIRIYATVAEDFTPEENIATVSSDTFDPDVGNNAAACTNQLCTGGFRGALEFPSASTTSVTVPSSDSLKLTGAGTLEAWIYPTEFMEDAGILFKGTAEACYGFGLCGGDPLAGDVFAEGSAQNIGFVLYDGTGAKHFLRADAELNAYQWYHIACTWQVGGTPEMVIYINGVSEAESSPGIANARTNDEDLTIGYQTITSGTYVGIVDEVRIWDAARIQDRIQDTMCHKITDAETDFGDLMGNWRFDERSGTVCNDISGLANYGLTDAERTCSEAPIGDDSIHDYIGSGATDLPEDFSVQLTYADQRLTATGENGDWGDDAVLKSGIQLYRVANAPDHTAGPPGWRLLDDAGYFGVFITGGTYPTYTVTYDYDANNDGLPLPGVSDEDNLRLAFRESNCRTWKDLVATLAGDELTQGGLSGTEFILGTYVDPRNAIDFDGTNDYVTCGNPAIFDITGDITIEAWVSPDAWAAGSTPGIIAKRSTYATMDWELFYNVASSRVEFWYGNSGAYQLFGALNASLATGIWQHVAVTNSGDVWSLYINGILQGTANNANAIPTGDTLIIGLLDLSAPNTTNCFDGKIDEVRIWDIARTQAQIQDTMCQKLAGTESGLVGYWRFDEETNSVNCPDYTTNGNAGTMTGFGTNPVGAGLDPIREHRICSSAPIGDDSDHDYNGGSSDITLAHSDGDSLRAYATAAGNSWGTGEGIHVYRLDEAPVYPPDLWDDTYYTYTTPNGLTPPSGWSSIDYYRYWGVFVTDWTNEPSFDVVYNYNGNPSVPVDDSQLGLARRPEYCFGTWSASGAALNTGADTLTITTDSLSGTPRENPEYVLGGIDDPLAIVLASFTAAINDGCIGIKWETATEIDTLGFQLWRSTKKNGPYAPVPGGFTQSLALMETMGASYNYTDCDVETDDTEYYYKLEEIDMDSGKDNAFYGPIGPVREGLTASQKAPKARSGEAGACFVSILSD